MTYGDQIRMGFRVCPKAPAVEDISRDSAAGGLCSFCGMPVSEHLTNAEYAAAAMERLALAHDDMAQREHAIAARLRQHAALVRKLG